MPEYNSKRILKIKALGRWENEGGKVFADQIGINKDSMSDKEIDKPNFMQISNGPTADRPEEGKKGVI